MDARRGFDAVPACTGDNSGNNVTIADFAANGGGVYPADAGILRLSHRAVKDYGYPLTDRYAATVVKEPRGLRGQAPRVHSLQKHAG